MSAKHRMIRLVRFSSNLIAAKGMACSLDGKTIKRLFVKTINILTTEKDEIAANFQAIKGSFSVQGTGNETVIASGRTECGGGTDTVVRENARVALDQPKYQKKYDGLAERLYNVQGRLEEVGSAITEKRAKKEQIERFLAKLER